MLPGMGSLVPVDAKAGLLEVTFTGGPL